MTARADRLTHGAKTPDHTAFLRSSYPASSLRVFVDGLERLHYCMAPLLAEAGIDRAELDDPDARIARSTWAAVFSRALEQRPMKNAGMRLAAVTPFGAFPLIDYLIATSRDVGEWLTRLGRYMRLAEARSAPHPLEEEDPIRVFLEGPDTPFSAEFTVTLNVLHFRKETDNQLRAAYASFRHEPDDVAEMERVLDCPVHARASWNGWALTREAWHLPLRRRDAVLSNLLQAQAEEAIARLPAVEDVVLDLRRALASRIAGDDTRIEAIARTLGTSARSLQRRLAAAGLSYRQLLDAGRREAAERYLSDSQLSIGEIAYLVGYSEAAAFNRAFRRWCHERPQVFRQRRRQARQP